MTEWVLNFYCSQLTVEIVFLICKFIRIILSKITYGVLIKLCTYLKL